jgi:hypothetical protein
METIINRFKNPVWWALFIALAIALVSLFPQLGEDGVMWCLLGAGVAVVLLAWLWDVLRQNYRRMMSGEPTRLDWGIAPGGYRRARQVETEEEQARYSHVQPTANRPLYVETDIEEMEPLQPKTALVRASSVSVEKYGESRGRNLRLASGCNPPIDMVIGRAVLFLGIRGSGKTNGLARFLEQVFRFPIPALVCDYEEDYLTFPDVLDRCLIAGAASWPGQHRLKRYWKVNARSSEEFGYSILEYGVQVVLQIGTFETLEEAAEVMTGAIRGMFRWAEEQAPAARVPALICLDEAQHFLPQNSSVSNIRGEQAAALLKAFMDINARGRKRGLTPIIATQRPAQIRKEVIAGSEIYFLMKQTNARDLDAYEELLGREQVDRRAITSFAKGECLVYESGESWRIRFLERESEHRGTTPTLTQALNRYGQAAAAPARFDFAGASSSWEERDTDDFAGFEEQDAEEFTEQEPETERQELASARPARVNREEQLIARAADAYQEGANSQPKLAAALNMKLWDVRQLMPKVQAEVKRRELIEQE